MKLIGTMLLLGALVPTVYAQRPRALESEPAQKTTTAPAPSSVKAKYEGGVFGYTKTMEGSLMLDDGNNQLLFKDKKTAKQIHIPYNAVTSAFADTQKRQPKAATVASNVPLIYSLPAHFIKTKVRYLTIQYSDPDTLQSGITSFKLENKDVLNSVLVSLAEKTGMTLRGDIYVKKRDVSKLLP
ncbi:MAG TPA: hypothetical protein VI306_21505 [Pyrinomonadaceae bacterium]